MEKRIDKDNYYLGIARAVAVRSTCLHHKYGAVIVNNDEIVSTGYNGAPRGELNCCDSGICYRDTNKLPVDFAAAQHGNKYGTCVAVHAEQNAIISASRKEMLGGILYLACIDFENEPAPCNVCNRLIKNAGIKRVVV